jgi:hypothetical protein
MGWLIGGIVALYLVARSNAAASICIAPVTGGTAPVTPTQSTIGPVHVSPSQSLVCHATAVGCPTLPSPATTSEGAVGGAQPISPLLPVQIANCHQISGPIGRPATDPVSAPVSGLPGNVPVVSPIFHCDHLICPVGPVTVFNPPIAAPVIPVAPIAVPVTPIFSKPVSLAPVKPQPLIKPPLGNQGGGSFGGIVEGCQFCLGDASREF